MIGAFPKRCPKTLLKPTTPGIFNGLLNAYYIGQEKRYGFWLLVPK